MTLAVGLIGAGMIGTEHATTIARRVSGAAVAGVFDVDTRRARAIAEATGAALFDFAGALVASDDIDAVVLATPGRYHAADVLACIDAGKPVMCEKPLAADVDDCVAVVEAEAKAGRRLVQVGFMRRFDPGYVEVKAAVSAGNIGQPLVLHNIHRNPAPPPSFSNEMMMTEAMIHEFDVSRWLLDDEVAAVRVLAPRPTPRAREGLLDPQVAILEMASGALADIEMFVTCTYGYDVRCEVVGSEGAVGLESSGATTLRLGGSRAQPIATGWKERFGEAYRLELQAWVDGALSGTATGPTAWDGYAATVIAARAVDAQRSGERTTVDLVDRPALYRPRT